MTIKNFETMDGNEAVARVAFQLNEVVALFPITPASPMGEWADAGVKNLWGTVPAPKLPVADYLNVENRFKMLSQSRPEEAKLLFKQA
ncbi:MAG TPA: hypothetical protein VK775_13350 [Chthoniobacterales bacterium]|jgi:pyruvate/2-oxoacid:ferredoxin oxidoreductase alpha subunit|nr:hypothetical protein [Chthoniobacterales bacterium]